MKNTNSSTIYFRSNVTPYPMEGHEGIFYAGGKIPSKYVFLLSILIPLELFLSHFIEYSLLWTKAIEATK